MKFQPEEHCSSPAKKWQGPGQEVVQHALSELGVGIFRHFAIRSDSDSGSHDPIPKQFLIYIFPPINSSAVQIHLYNFKFEPKLPFLCFLFMESLCVSTAILKVGVWIFTGFMIQFNYDYHYQLNITMRHILSFQYYCTWLHFHIHFISNLFCAKCISFFYYISRLLFKTITYLK